MCVHGWDGGTPATGNGKLLGGSSNASRSATKGSLSEPDQTRVANPIKN